MFVLYIIHYRYKGLKMKSIHHNKKPSSHWLSIIFVVFFIGMAADALEDGFTATTNYNNYSRTTDAEVDRQMTGLPPPDSQASVVEAEQHMESAGRFTRVYPEDASLMEKALYVAEYAYDYVVRVNRKLFQLLSRAVQYITASMVTLSH